MKMAHAWTIWQRTKMRYAEWLNRGDRYCWAKLVAWSLVYEFPFHQPRNSSGRKHDDKLRDCLSGECKADLPCYCGKFQPAPPTPSPINE